jgi:uncharacterized repeat protein (TIGR01451 family)
MFRHKRHIHTLGQKKRQTVPLFAWIAIWLSFLIPLPASAALPAGFQEYYVLGYEEHVWRAFLAINDDDPPELQVGKICSTVNLVATADHQIVYYDHWEDGYEADLINPIQPTTEVYGDGNSSNGGSESDILATGDAINLTSNQDISGATVITGYVAVNPARDPDDLRYDGGDRIITSGGPINLTHAMWPLDTTYVGGAWEVYSRQAYADAYSYRLPVGEDLYDLGGGDEGIYGDFRNVYLQLGAFEDNTTVSIRNKTGTVNLTLDQGEIYSSMGYINSSPAPAITINTGTVVRTNKETQVGLITGADGSFQGRFLIVLPDRQWGADYVVPVPRGYGRGDDDSYPDAPAEVYLFNPNSFPIEIQAYDATTQTSFIISPTATYTKATVAYSQQRGGAYIPQDSAARFTSDDGAFGTVVCADTSHIDYDWGFAGTPSKYLTRDYYISWAPGDDNTPPANNGAPVWVTPLADGTTFLVDFNENPGGLDGIVDEMFTLDVLQQQRIFDPDNDNTGMHVWATGEFAVAWGADARTSDPSDPYLDLGVAMLPLQQRWLDPVLTLDKTADPTILPSTGGAVTFTLVAQSYNTPLVNVDISDTLPISWTYVPNSTHITYPDRSTGNPEPTIDGRLLSWDTLTDLEFNQSLTLTFQAQITDTGGVDTSAYDGFESGDYSGGANWGTGNWQEWGDDNDPTTGTVRITASDSPFAGLYHLRIRGSDTVTGCYAISRSVDLSDFTKPVLHFRRQVRSLESGDHFHLDIYDGVGWTTVLTWTNGSQEFTTIGEVVDLSPHAGAASAIRFRSDDIFGQDVLLIDQVKIQEGVAVSVNQGEAIGRDECSDALFNPTDEATVHISPLKLFKSVSRAEAGINDTLVYTLSFTNLGDSSATNVAVHDAVPTQYVTFESVSAGGTYNGDSGIVIVVDTLAPGASRTVTFSVTVNDFVEDGTVIENIAYIESDQTVKAGSNLVRTTVLAPDIEFTKSGPTVAYPGEAITYTLSYQNIGGAQATGVTIQDTIPPSTTYIPGSLSIITGTEWVKLTDSGDADQGAYISPTLVITPGTIDIAETGQIRFSVQLDADLPFGSLVQNWATLDRYLDNPRDTNLVITRISDLLIHKKARPTQASPGDTISYTLVYTNTSMTTGHTAVYVRERIPDHTTFVTVTESACNPVEYSWDNGVTWNATLPITPVTHIRWYDAQLPPNTQVVLSFTVLLDTTLPPHTVIQNTAYISSENTSPHFRGGIPSNQVQVKTIDLWIDKTVNPHMAHIGDPVSYTISYGNRGSANAFGVQILDTIPTNTDYITGSIWGTGAYTGAMPTLLWNVGAVPAGSDAQEVGYAATLDDSLLPGAVITNSAFLISTYETEVSDPVTVTTMSCADLTMTKSSDPSIGSAGERLTYTLVITNGGPGYAAGVVVSDTPPANTQFVPNSIVLDPPGAGIAGTSPPTLASDITIAPGHQVTVTFAVTVTTPLADGTVITNTAAVTSIGVPTPITSFVTTTIHSPVFTLTKQAGNDWSRRVKLTFNNTEQSEDLIDFPVLVTLDGARIDYSQTQNGGQDIRFIDPDGSMLAHEIERWDESAKSYVWVQVPQIDGSSDTDYIWMYYGNPDAPDGQNPTHVWAEEYRMVYHLAEDPVLTGGITQDSTPNGFDATNHGSTDAVGIIANAQRFESVRHQYVNLGWDLPVINGVAAATLSAWIKDGGNGDIIGLSRGNPVPIGNSRASITRRDRNVYVYARSLDDDSETYEFRTTTDPLLAGTWHYVAAVINYANDAITVCVDGVPQATVPAPAFAHSTTPDTNSASSALGSDDNGLSAFFDGLIDEARVAATARSVDWIAAQHRSMTDNLIVYGIEEQPTAPATSPIIGAPFTYTLTITNTGLGSGTNVVVTDTLGAEAHYVSGGSFISSSNTVQWTIPAIPAGDSEQATCVVSTCQASLLNAAYRVATSTQKAVSPPGPPLLTVLTPPTVEADFDYSPPSGAISTTVSFTGTATTNGGPITEWAWDLGDGDIASGSTISHSYPAPGLYTVTLTVTDACGYTDAVTKAVPVYRRALAIAKSAEPPMVRADELLTYTITVSNTGQETASGVCVSDKIPAHTSLVGATSPYTGPVNGVIWWSLGALDVSATRSVTMVVHVDGSVPSGTVITNTAWVTSAQGITNADTITTPILSPEVSFASGSYSVNESDGPAIITVTLSHPAGLPVTVGYATFDGTATAGDDYTAASGTLDFPPLSTAQTFSVSIISDPIAEPDETVVLSLTGATNATVSTIYNPATLTILDDDGPAVIQGTVFADMNGNGVQDAGETGIPTAMITLDETFTTTTASDGGYILSVTTAGVHTVVETDPLASASCDGFAMDPIYYFSTTPNEVHVDVTLGHAYQVDFGDAPPNSGFASIHGVVFEDMNGNGAQDAAELGISGVIITLDGDETTTTGLYGTYTLSATTEGTHIVTATQPNGYFSTTPDEVHVDVRMGNARQVNFGDAPIGSNFAAIYGTVFNDINQNGLHDGNELGIRQVTVTLDQDTTDTTGPYGSYTLSTTVTGVHTVIETDPSGYTSTTPNTVSRSVALGSGYQADFGDKETCNPDYYEPDDTIEQASLFVVGPSSQAHQFCDDATDWVRFSADVHTVYSITTYSFGAWADTILALFSLDHPTQTLAYNDDCEGATDGSSCIFWEAPANGDYYVHVTNQNGLTGTNTNYDLWIKSEGSSAIYLPIVMRSP